jgi:hypothetical protein
MGTKNTAKPTAKKKVTTTKNIETPVPETATTEQPTERNYLNGCFVKAKTFEKYGNTILNIDIEVDKVIKQLETMRDKKGYCRLIITEKPKASVNGITHTCYFNEWIPVPQDTPSPTRQAVEEENADMPF